MLRKENPRTFVRLIITYSQIPVLCREEPLKSVSLLTVVVRPTHGTDTTSDSRHQRQNKKEDEKV